MQDHLENALGAWIIVVTQLLMFGASLETVQRRKVSRRPTAAAAKTSNQLALF